MELVTLIFTAIASGGISSYAIKKLLIDKDFERYKFALNKNLEEVKSGHKIEQEHRIKLKEQEVEIFRELWSLFIDYYYGVLQVSSRAFFISNPDNYTDEEWEIVIDNSDFSDIYKRRLREVEHEKKGDLYMEAVNHLRHMRADEHAFKYTRSYDKNIIFLRSSELREIFSETNDLFNKLHSGADLENQSKEFFNREMHQQVKELKELKSKIEDRFRKLIWEDIQ